MIFLIGDVHGKFFPIFEWIDEVAQEGDTLISVGDFGMGFRSADKTTLNWMASDAESKGAKVVAIRGNHDDPAPFRENRKIGEGLEFIPDYSLRNLDGQNVLLIGGAISIDRAWRIEGQSYWKDEVITEDLSLVEGVRADIVVTHSAPDLCNPTSKSFENIKWAIDRDPALKTELPLERKYLTEVYNKLSETKVPEKWFYGHFHTALTEFVGETRFQCLNIDEITMVV